MDSRHATNADCPGGEAAAQQLSPLQGPQQSTSAATRIITEPPAAQGQGVGGSAVQNGASAMTPAARESTEPQAQVPECVLRAIYPERFADEPEQKSKSEIYAESLHNVHICKKETYQNIIVPFLEEQRRKGVPACPGELGST